MFTFCIIAVCIIWFYLDTSRWVSPFFVQIFLAEYVYQNSLCLKMFYYYSTQQNQNPRKVTELFFTVVLLPVGLILQTNPNERKLSSTSRESSHYNNHFFHYYTIIQYNTLWASLNTKSVTNSGSFRFFWPIIWCFCKIQIKIWYDQNWLEISNF